MQHEGVKRPDGAAGGIWQVIWASSAGTLIEWYDFFVFGSLATVLATQFFPKGNSTAALLSTLATFATGFLVRPFGALFFGRMGDLLGRKHTFLLTLLMMGLSTAALGLIPTYETIGILAPLLVLTLRLLQGLAVGGEYGGATTYVAEHAPRHRQGYYTSFIQTTATLGLLASLLVILLTRGAMSDADFNKWGWRVPFLLSSLLIALSYVVRSRLQESPMFKEIKAAGTTSKNPLKDSFVEPENRKRVLLALFGVTAGQGVVWYTGQFYALYFLQTVLNIQAAEANKIIAWALVLGTPLFVVIGGLSDRIGRKWLIMAGCLLAAVLYIPIYGAMKQVGTLPSGLTAAVSIESKLDVKTHKASATKVELFEAPDGTTKTVKTPLDASGQPSKKDADKPKTEVKPSAAMFWGLAALVWVQVVFVTLVYGPIAAFLVELFPTRIRYTSMSLPYHLGNGVFGGLVPLIGTAVVASTKDPLSGVWYPIGIAAVTFVVGAIAIKERPTEEGFEVVS
jgi:MHS family proline/betaine transporter-like MFS transporter